MANDMSERMKSLRERAKNKKSPVDSETSNEDGEQFASKRWFHKIRSALDTDKADRVVLEAGKYYEEAILDGQRYIAPKGNLETLMLQLGGITYFYQGILVDCQQSRKWAEERGERKESEMYIHYMYSDEVKSKLGAAPKTTEASKMAKADDRVKSLEDAARYLSYFENQLITLMDALQNLKYTLNNVVTIRKENLTEVWVDPAQGTKNE